MARVFQYFPRLAERRGQQAGTLSGGEQQMLAIGRALMMQPRLLVLDEPSFGLAPMVVQDIYGILKAIRQEERTTMLIVEQHAHVALALADTAHVLGLGRFTLSGDARTVAADPATRRSYLGD
jgi:branched-chain amino acid transport system ATP-binding protein